ncbi:hypothetical protein [Pontibacter akesuensis]|nr:hypothetical protein [Pontibacter akesuensis]
MKQIYTLLLLIAAAATTACDKDQKTLNQLDGTWQVKEVTHLKQDTTKLPSSGTITLTKCNLDDAAKSCPGTFTFNSQPSKELVYSVMDKGKTINFTAAGSHEGFMYMLYGPWKVVQQTDDRLELEGEAALSVFNAATRTPKRVDVRMVLER